MASSRILTRLPAKSSDFKTIWTYLERGLDLIMTSPESFPSGSYTLLYTVVYNYCSSSSSPTLAESSKINRNAWKILQVKDRRDAGVAGARLYMELIQYFVAYLKNIRDNANRLREEALLTYYADEWRRYTAGTQYVHRVFSYLNRSWVAGERRQKYKNVYPVYTLALVQWKDHLLVPMQQQNNRLTIALLHLVERQRNGETIDQSLLKMVVDSFVALGLNDEDLIMRCLDVYRDHIETPFLAVTKALYEKKSEAFLLENNVPDYRKKTTEWLQEEKDRIEGYLAIETQTSIISVFEEVFAHARASAMWDTFQSLPEFHRDAVLQLRPPLSRIREELALSREKLEEDFKHAGLDAVSTLVGEDGGAPDLQDYVDALLKIRAKYSAFVAQNLKGDPECMISFNKICGDIVNQKAPEGTSTSISPELLVKHTDLLLRKNSEKVKEQDLDDALDIVMVIFNYLEDKDIFERFYTSRLSKRLIYDASVSDESEAGMVSKLGEACGPEYTTKLRQMLTDMKLSKDLTDQFNLERKQDSDTDMSFSVMVLGTNSWPLDPPSDGFTIPRDIYPTYDLFQQYYQAKHSGRKLTWLWNYSRNELRTNYLDQKYILMTSSFQMAILVMYNSHDTLSLTELVTATSIPKSIITQILAILVKAKILVNEEPEQYDLNPDFRSKKIRINLNRPIKTEEMGEVLKNVDEDRKYVIQTTIVRVMKARQSMKNQQLIQEVISQLSQRFTPNVADIKKAIGILLEKEYIERVKGTKDSFAYVA